MKLRFTGSFLMLCLGTWFWTALVGVSFGLLTPVALYFLIQYICKNIEVVRAE